MSTPSGRRIRVTFNGSVSDVLPWKFTPQQREVRVYPGETALAFYTATNRAPDRDIVGIATYSVTPGQAAPYFSKIQCFCFEEQRLNRGESVDMPVFFFIDPDFVNDPAMAGIETITLSYTFFSMLLFLSFSSSPCSFSLLFSPEFVAFTLTMHDMIQKQSTTTTESLIQFLAHHEPVLSSERPSEEDNVHGCMYVSICTVH